MSPKPSLVLVHGSWHCPAHFDELKANLENQYHYRCVTVALPSTQSPDTPPASFADDTAAVRTTVLAELTAGLDVVVVAHSYGGAPANNALHALDPITRGPGNPAVRALVFLASMPLAPGVALLDLLGGGPTPMHDLRNPHFAWVGAPGPAHYFYNEQDPATAAHAAALLRPQSWKAFGGRTTHAAAAHLPCYVLCCRKDQAFQYEYQVQLLDGLRKAGGPGVVVETIDADHSPYMGKFMEFTSGFIRRAAEETKVDDST